MRKGLIIIFSLLVLLPITLSFHGPAYADDSGWAVDFDLTYNSKYVWRGILFVDDPVLQPSVNVSKGGFTFNVWGNYELTDVNDYGAPYGDGKNKFTEIDLTAEYAFSWGDFSFPVGIIHYLFPNTPAAATTEIYAGASYDWVVSPGLTVYQDIDEAHGQYVLASASYSLGLPAIAKDVTWSADLSAQAGWGSSEHNKFYFGVDDAAFTDCAASLAFPVAINKYLTVAPAVTYTALLDSKIKDTKEKDSNTFYGVSVTLSF